MDDLYESPCEDALRIVLYPLQKAGLNIYQDNLSVYGDTFVRFQYIHINRQIHQKLYKLLGFRKN